jgi:SpoVK/Ycf46/Vps4 family AAA+-type ATPase
MEDPIEFVHKDNLSYISQREVGEDTDGFDEAFKKVKSPLTKRDIERYEKWAEEFGTKF